MAMGKKRTQKEYESGTFTIDLMQLSCPDNEIKDNISFVKKWTKFINGENDFLYKNPKGDVWIINVSGNPSRSYSYGSQYMETTVTYEWVQIIKIDDVVVKVRVIRQIRVRNKHNNPCLKLNISVLHEIRIIYEVQRFI